MVKEIFRVVGTSDTTHFETDWGLDKIRGGLLVFKSVSQENPLIK